MHGTVDPRLSEPRLSEPRLSEHREGKFLSTENYHRCRKSLQFTLKIGKPAAHNKQCN